MGIVDRVRMARENFRQQAERKAATQALQNKLDLEDAKAQKAALQQRQDVNNALKQEKSQLRDLKHPFIANVREKIKQGGGSALENFKTRSALAGKGRRGYAQEARPRVEASTSPFSPQNSHLLGGGQSSNSLGNSPFSPQNVNRFVGNKPTSLKKQKSKSITIIVRK